MTRRSGIRVDGDNGKFTYWRVEHDLRIAGAAAALAVAGFVTAAAPKADGAAGIAVDKDKKTVTVDGDRRERSSRTAPASSR